jgi:predicted AAA+ superfamily ATPase
MFLRPVLSTAEGFIYKVDNMSRAKYSKKQIILAKNLIRHCEIPRDSLPYHAQFEEIYNKYLNAGMPNLSKHEFWLLLSNAGKKGGARQLRKERLLTVPITQEEKFELLRLCPENIGSRDRLPYTTEFEHMYEQFKVHTGRNLTKNDFWRALSKTAKLSRKPNAVDYNPTNELPRSLVRDLFTMNPWWRGDSSKTLPYYKRHIYRTLYDKMTRGHLPIIALRGPRQVGKTTLQEQMIDEMLHGKRLVGPDQILRIQFDDIKSLNLVSDPIITIIDWFERNILKDTFNNVSRQRKPVYIFLDEIQDVPNWNEQIKHIVDNKECKIYVTGSSALRILIGRESLAGRIDYYVLSPLGLTEIAGFRDYDSMKTFTNKIDLVDWQKKQFWEGLSEFNPQPLLLERVYKDYSNFGGYPFCHKGQITTEEVEKYLYDTVVNRTIDHDLKASIGVGRGGQNSSLLRKTFKAICKYTGQDIAIRTIAQEVQDNTLQNPKPGQIKDIIDFFTDSLLINVIESFEHRLRRTKDRVRICLCDHAIRASWLKERIPLYGNNVNADLAGHIIESIIGNYLSTVEGLAISFLAPTKSEGEVDLIMGIGDMHIPIEMKYQNNPKVTSGIKVFMSKRTNNAPFGIIITKGDSWVKDDLVAIPAKQFLLLK